MNASPRTLLTAAMLVWLHAHQSGLASSTLPVTTAEHVRRSVAVVRGTVTELTCYRDATDGRIYTRATVRVEEVFKGHPTASLDLVYRGGVVGHEGEDNGLSPDLRAGEERLFLLTPQGRGTWGVLLGAPSALKLERVGGRLAPPHRRLLQEIRSLTDTPVPQSDAAADGAGDGPPGNGPDPCGPLPGGAYGYAVDGTGVPARWVAQDRAEPIPYLVDAAALPSGITLTQALTAVSNALGAWAAVSSLRFTFEGLRTFGLPAPNIATNDGRLRLQLHDSFGYIANPSILGIGGRSYSTPLLSGAGWGTGGKVGTVEFHNTRYGYVILSHTNVMMQDLYRFTEVLGHEAGHALGLKHSSDVTTNDTCLTDALMYYLSHGGTRGATLGTWDAAVILRAYPLTNTPPWTYPRVLDITTAWPSAPNVPGINEVEVRGYDRQSTNLTLAVTNTSASAGAFSLTGRLLKFTPSDFYSAPRLDPATSSYYDIAYARCADGTNASPYALIRTISLNPDQNPATSDGLPDDWMTACFGHVNPLAGDKSRATDDYDGDGLSNLQEYRAGMDPTNRTSAQRITAFTTNSVQWQAKPYELYEVLGSTNLSNWARLGNPVLPTTTNALATNLPTPGPRQFYRILKVP